MEYKGLMRGRRLHHEHTHNDYQMHKRADTGRQVGNQKYNEKCDSLCRD